MTKLIITDMDGTVIDSMKFLGTMGAAVLQHAARISNNDAWSFYQSSVGIPFVRQLKRWNDVCTQMENDDNRIAELETHAELYSKIHSAAAPLFPLTEFGRSLARQRFAPDFPFKLALVTSTHRSILDRMPQLYGVSWNFVGGFDGRDYTKSEQVRACMDKLQVIASDAVYVGDSTSDQAIAESHEMAFHFPSAQLLDILIDGTRR